jgi:hypothetical protein
MPMKNKVSKLATALLIAVIPLMMTSCSTSSNSEEPVEGTVTLHTITGVETVQAINPEDRTVVLLHGDGSTSVYKCGPDVRNFNQIKVGDQVTATVAESVALVLTRDGMPPAAGTASVMVRAPLGDKPAARMVDTTAFTAKVVGIDATNRTVTLETPSGPNQTIEAGPGVDLAAVSIGDTVGVKITKAIAIAVTSPNAAP